MPPYSFGDCGAQSPAFLAFSRTGLSRESGMFSCSEKFIGSDSSGSTCSSTKARVRTRSSSISGDSVKSIEGPSLCLDTFAARTPAAPHRNKWRAGRNLLARARDQSRRSRILVSLVGFGDEHLVFLAGQN